MSEGDSATKDLDYMRLALVQAEKCIGTPTAYCVGAVIVLPRGRGGNTLDQDVVLSTGYSRELPGNTHAEECALKKLSATAGSIPVPQRRSCVLYTTMEPCSERLSGNTPCVDRVLASDIFGVVKCGVVEPDTFIKNNTGRERLAAAGIEYQHVSGLEAACMAAATKGHPGV
ncbi:cytidine deaminase-like protein [Limtongia smithiae]|uniref:cytidine deaminase-like protein n=1 Tax=Limtongia smithiae TaxID=1125753 RepID=UPI0034CFBB36